MGVRKLDIRNHLVEKARLLGNSDEKLMDLCQRLIVQYGTDSKSIAHIANVTHLSPSCIRRFVTLEKTELGHDYSPMADSCERILKFFGVEISCNQVKIASRYMPSPKGWLE